MVTESTKRNEFHPDYLNLTGGGHDYAIDRDRLDSGRKAVSWILHLSEKTWITRQDLIDVASYAVQYGGVDPHNPPV